MGIRSNSTSSILSDNFYRTTTTWTYSITTNHHQRRTWNFFDLCVCVCVLGCSRSELFFTNTKPTQTFPVRIFCKVNLNFENNCVPSIVCITRITYCCVFAKQWTVFSSTYINIVLLDYYPIFWHFNQRKPTHRPESASSSPRLIS